MIVELRNPTRTMQFQGPMSVAKLLSKLKIDRQTVLVIANKNLVAFDSVLQDQDHVEIRSVISGG